MKKIIMWFSSIGLMFLLSQSVIAMPMQEGKGCHCQGPMMLMMMKKDLNLTQEQQDKLSGFKEQNKGQLKEKWEQMKALRDQMHELVKSEKVDEAKLDQLITQKKELMGEMTKMKVMMHHQLYAILTDTQKKQLEDMRKNMSDKCPCEMMQKNGMKNQMDTDVNPE